MADIVTPEKRSLMMAGILGRDTKPEMLIRKGLHALGYRYLLGSDYRLRGKALPGKPDLVFPARRAVIMVHGCFWHGHDCGLFRWPASNAEFWSSKIISNITRDRRVREQLITDGWRVLEVWECALKGRQRLPSDEVLSACTAFLQSGTSFASIGRDQTVTVSDPA